MTRRVLWLTKGLGRGGAERLLTTCAPHVERDRFEVEVAYLMPAKSAYVDRLRGQGIAVHCLDGGSDLDLRWSARLRALLRDGDFALLHTHSPMPASVARVVALGGGTRIVHTAHNMWSRYHRATYWANALTYTRNDAVIAVSQAVADSIRPQFLSPRVRRQGIDVVLHGIDLDERSGVLDRAAARTALGLPADALVVGTVGNLTEKKDHRLLVQAFADLRRSCPGAHLCIVGSGPLEHQLAGWVREAGVAEVTTLAGSRDDAAELMAAFDVFALSSRFEGLSIALVEALACGVPCVATRVGGVPEVLDEGGAGVMVPAGDRRLLAEALRGVLCDDERRAVMGRAATARAQDFDIRRSTRQIETIYDRVLAS